VRPAASMRQLERFRFEFHESTAKPADRFVELRRPGGFQVGEKTRRPRREMPLEKPGLRGEIRLEGALRQPGHDLAKDRNVILRFAGLLGPLDAEPRQILTHARQRALMQEAGLIIRAVRQQLAAPNPDEQVEIFAALARSMWASPSGVASPRRLDTRASRSALGACPSRTESKAYSDPRRASMSSTSVTTTSSDETTRCSRKPMLGTNFQPPWQLSKLS
jgi:hypothetical protein